MPWFPSWLGANWALALAVLLVVVGLGFLAFFLKNWKAVAAALAIAAVAFAFMWTDRNAYQRRVNEEKAAHIERLEANAKLSNDIADDYKARVERDAAEIEELRKLVEQTPPNTNIGLNKGAAERVGVIQ